jgi:hypothetical protein
MDWISKTTALGPRHFVIKYDANVGFYLYVFENNKCTRDYLQDSLEAAKSQAMEEFGVPTDSWKRVTSAS